MGGVSLALSRARHGTSLCFTQEEHIMEMGLVTFALLV